MAELAIKEDGSDALEVPFEVGEVQTGDPLPIGGAHQYGDGVNFVLFSRHATGVRLELYQNADDSSPTKVIDFDPASITRAPRRNAFLPTTVSTGRWMRLRSILLPTQ